MPHFLAQNFSATEYPFCDGEYTFLFEVQSLNGAESLICVSYGQQRFFVRKIKRQKEFLFKAQKITKPNPIGILKGALRILAKKSDVLLHNLNNDSMRQVLKSEFLLKPSEILKLDLRDFCVEIGFGSGRHLLTMAQKNPNTKYIGLEIHTPSIEQVLRQIELLGLQNVFIVCIDARILLEMLPSNKCKAIYVHFPVPWNKKPHRRVISAKLVSQALRVLKPDCMLELRTDDEEYFRDSLEIGLEMKNAKLEVAKNLSNEVVSKYEARWQRQCKNIFDLRFFSLTLDEDEKIEYDFVFDFFASKHPELLCGRQKIVKEDYFLHICDGFTSDSFVLLLLSFGDFNWPVNKIIVFDKQNQEAYYFGEPPLATRANIMAHQELLKLLAEDK